MSTGHGQGMIFCEVCKKKYPGASKADVFKHNLTWEHRSKLGASQSSERNSCSRGSGASGKQQQETRAGGKFDWTLLMADTTASVGTSIESWSGTSSQSAQTQRPPTSLFPAPPPLPNNHPPPARYFTRPPRHLHPPGPPPYPPLSQQPVSAGWPPRFPQRPLFPPHAAPPMSICSNPSPAGCRVSPPSTPSPGLPSTTDTANTQHARPAVPSAQVEQPSALPASQSCGTQTKPTKTNPTPTFSENGAPQKKHPATTVGGRLPPPPPPYPPPTSSQQSSRPPPPPTLPIPVGKIGYVTVSLPSPDDEPSPKSGPTDNKEKSGGTQDTTKQSSSSSKKQTESEYGRKLPAMRIPKLSDRRPKNLEGSVSPSVTWDSPQTLSPKVSSGKNSPFCPTASNNGSASANSSVRLATPQPQKAASSSPKEKKKKKISTASEVTTATEDTSSSGLAEQAGRKSQEPKRKKNKDKEAQGKNHHQRTVIRDTSPKFIPPEKTKKPWRSQPGGSTVSIEPMEVSQPEPCSSSKASEQQPLSCPPGSKATQRPSSLITGEAESSSAPNVAELAKAFPPKSAQRSHDLKKLAPSSNETDMEDRTAAQSNRSCMTESASQTSPRSFKLLQKQSSVVVKRKKSSSSEPPAKQTESKVRSSVTEPEREKPSSPKSFKTTQHPRELKKKSCSSAPQVKVTQSKRKLSVTEPAKSQPKCSNLLRPQPDKAGHSESSGTEDSEEQLSGFVLRLPPTSSSRVKGGSLLFGDVSRLESQENVKMGAGHQQELEKGGKKGGVGLSDTQELSTVAASAGGTPLSGNMTSTAPNGSTKSSSGCSKMSISQKPSVVNPVSTPKTKSSTQKSSTGSALSSSQKPVNGSTVLETGTVNGSAALKTGTVNGSAVSRQPDSPTTQLKRRLPVEATGKKTLAITRTSSDGYRGQKNGPRQLRPRSSSLPERDSTTVDKSGGVGGQKRPSSTSSSAEGAPPIPVQSNLSQCLTLSLVPASSATPVKNEPLPLTNAGPAVESEEGNNMPVFALISDVFEKIQHKLDFEVSKMRLMDLGQIPSSNPQETSNNSTPTVFSPVESKTHTLPFGALAQGDGEEKPAGSSAPAATRERVLHVNEPEGESKVQNDLVEVCAAPNGETNSSALPKDSLASGKRQSDTNSLPVGNALPPKTGQSDSEALLTSEKAPPTDSTQKAPLPPEKEPSDSNVSSKEPSDSISKGALIRPLDSNTLPEGPLPHVRTSESTVLQEGPKRPPTVLQKGQKRQSSVFQEAPKIHKRDPPVPCAMYKNSSRGGLILSTPPKFLKLNRPTPKTNSSSVKKLAKKGVNEASELAETTPPIQSHRNTEPASSSVKRSAKKGASEFAENTAAVSDAVTPALEIAIHRSTEPASHGTPDREAKSRSTSPRLDVIINSLKSKRRKMDESDGFSSNSSSSLGGRGSRRKKRKKSVHEDKGVKKIRLEASGSSKRECVENYSTTTPSLEPAMDTSPGVGVGRRGGGGGGGMGGESETENMSVSSSQHSSSREGDPALMTPHRKFASDIAALDKRDRELQEKLMEAQSQVDAMAALVQEAESHLVVLTQQQRLLALQRTELTDQYQKLLVEKQNLFSSPSKESNDAAPVTATKPNFLAKMKDLSEKEQDMQMKLLQGNQYLEEVSIKRSREEKKLDEAKTRKLGAVQSQFSMLKREYQEVQRKKQDLLKSSWNIPLPPSPLPSEKSEGILPLASTCNAAPDSSNSTSVESPTTEEACEMMEVEPGCPNTQSESVAGDPPMEEKVASYLHNLPPDHSTYTQQLHPPPPSRYNHSFPNPPRITPVSESLERTKLTPLTPQERLYSSPPQPAANTNTTNQPSVQCNDKEATAGNICEVDSILFPESVSDSQSTPPDQQQSPSTAVAPSKSVGTATNSLSMDTATNSNVAGKISSLSFSTVDGKGKINNAPTVGGLENTGIMAIIIPFVNGEEKNNTATVDDRKKINTAANAVANMDGGKKIETVDDERKTDTATNAVAAGSLNGKGKKNTATSTVGTVVSKGTATNTNSAGSLNGKGEKNTATSTVGTVVSKGTATNANSAGSLNGKGNKNTATSTVGTVVSKGTATNDASTVDSEKKIGGVIVKLEHIEFDGVSGAGTFERSDGGAPSTASDSEGDGIRQAWMAAKALLSTRASTPELACGDSRDLPLEVGEEGEGEGENGQVGESLSGEVEKKEKGEVVEATSTSAGGEVGKVEEESESDGDTITEYSPHQNSVLGVKVSGGYLYSCSSDQSVRVYNVTDTHEVKEFKNHSRSVTCIEIFTCCGETYLVSGSIDKHIIMYHAKSGKIEIDFSLGARVQCMVSQGSLLVAGLGNGFIHLLNLHTKSALGRWLVGDDPVKKGISCLAINNNRLLTASYDNRISCWDISDYMGGEEGSPLNRVHQISSFSGMVLCMQVEGNLLYCGSADTTLQIFNTQTWVSCGRAKGHNGAISGLSVNGNLLITSCFDRLIRCFDARDKTLLQVYGTDDLPFTLCSVRDSVYCGLRSGKLISIKIDLSTYHQCQWKDCGIKFGIRDHLRLHMKEHSSNGSDSVTQCQEQSQQPVVQSPATPLPTTSGVSPAPATPTTSDTNEATYLQAHRELQAYLPLICHMMAHMLAKEGFGVVSKSQQFTKLKTLKYILQDVRNRIPLETLLKCKKAFKDYKTQVQLREQPAPPLPSPLSRQPQILPPSLSPP